MTKKQIVDKIKLWLPAIIWAGVIFFLSNQTINQTTVSFSWVDFILKKTAHAVEYGILFWLVWRANKSLKLSLIICLIFALSDEWHQTFVPGREGTLRDVGFDTIGAFFALTQIKYRL